MHKWNEETVGLFAVRVLVGWCVFFGEGSIAAGLGVVGSRECRRTEPEEAGWVGWPDCSTSWFFALF
jgi:hypothetical protein